MAAASATPAVAAAATAPTMCPPRMLCDLRFSDAHQEGLFQELHTQCSVRLEKHVREFHCARALAWLLVLLRMLAAHQWRAVALLAAGCLSTLLPALLSGRLPQHKYRRWRLLLLVADNVLQLAMGCYAHHAINPASPTEAPSTFQMAAALLTGSGVAWLVFCPVWCSLPFRVAFPQQAALTIVLLYCNSGLCRGNAAIQLAYSTVGFALSRRAALAVDSLAAAPLWQRWETAIAAGRSCSAAVLAAPPRAREAVRAACMQAAEASLAAAAKHTRAAAAAPSMEHGAALCTRFQPASLLLLGFLLPMLVVWAAERRMRARFLAARAPPGSRLPPGLPSLLDFAMLVMPAVAAMYSYVIALG